MNRSEIFTKLSVFEDYSLDPRSCFNLSTALLLNLMTSS